MNRRWQIALLPVLLVAGITLVGCAKRPAVIMAGSPGGTGATSSVQGATVTQQTTVTQRETSASQGAAASQSTQSESTASAQSGAASSARAGDATATGGAAQSQSGQSAAAASSGETAAQPAASPSATVAQTTPRPDRRDFESMSQLEPIYFDFDKSDIRADAARTLQTNANWFRSNPNYLILIEGHCDERGTNEYNLALGERRARSTMNYLVAQGVASSRMTIISYGEERPVCTEHNEACWQKNRRAAFLVKETVPSALPSAVTGAGSGASVSAPAPTGKKLDGKDPVTDPVSSPSRPGALTPPNPQKQQTP